MNNAQVQSNKSFKPLSQQDLADKESFIRIITEGIVSDCTDDEDGSSIRRSLKSLKKQVLNSSRKVRENIQKARKDQKSYENCFKAKEKEEMIKQKVHCSDQLTLIQRHIYLNKMSDVARFSQNLLQFLGRAKFPEKNLYLMAASCHAIRACASLGLMDKVDCYLARAKDYLQNSDAENLKIEYDIVVGEVLVRKGQLKEAAVVWEEVIDKLTDKDELCRLHHELGRCYFELGSRESAHQHAEKAIELGSYPWTCFSYLLLGQLAVGDDIQEALKNFEEASELCHTVSDNNAIAEYIESSISLLQEQLGNSK